LLQIYVTIIELHIGRFLSLSGFGLLHKVKLAHILYAIRKHEKTIRSSLFQFLLTDLTEMALRWQYRENSPRIRGQIRSKMTGSGPKQISDKNRSKSNTDSDLHMNPDPESSALRVFGI
jgi:hypothetical protein